MTKIYYHASLLGKRPTNEDEELIIINKDGKQPSLNKINYYAIFDGHGGSKVSKFLKDTLAVYFMKKNVKYPLDKKNIKTLFANLQSKLLKEHKFSHYSGSTCLIVIEYKHKNDNYIHTINLGDSRAVLCSNNADFKLTDDHDPDSYVERQRIEQMGGKVYYDGDVHRIGNLSVSRAFGDGDSMPYISCKPDILKRKILKNDQFIIMGCDGLWDVMNNSDAVNFVLNNLNKDKRINIAKKLAENAIIKGSTDNVSVIIIML
jgi:serine/threonine protein phosphatase PrpC